MNSLINCHIVSWKRFLQTGLELIFVHIQIKTWWMILSSAKQINLNATCSKRPIKRSISDLTHKYAHTAIILYIYNSSYSDPFVLKSHHHYHVTCSNSITGTPCQVNFATSGTTFPVTHTWGFSFAKRTIKSGFTSRGS